MFYIPILILIFIQFKEKNNKMIKMLIFILIFYFTQTYKWWPRFVIFLPFFSFLSYIYLWEKFKQKNLEAFLITIGILTFTEGMSSLIFFEPFNFKESLFIPKFVKNSIGILLFFLHLLYSPFPSSSLKLLNYEINNLMMYFKILKENKIIDKKGKEYSILSWGFNAMEIRIFIFSINGIKYPFEPKRGLNTIIVKMIKYLIITLIYMEVMKMS